MTSSDGAGVRQTQAVQARKSNFQLVPPLPESTEQRRTPLAIHAHLRELIVSGVLEPGTELNQARLAKVLGVSRIPMREAFRLLQQEGLLDAEPDQRALVASLKIEEQDAIWAERVLVETLAIRVGASSLSMSDLTELAAFLDEMQHAHRSQDHAAFGTAHRHFHSLAGRGAGTEINRMITSLADKTTRFLAFHGRTVPHSEREALEDHRQILRRLRRGDIEGASRATALHIGRPGLIYIRDVEPTFIPRAVLQAMAMIGISDSLS